ncbi:uncharacterized protein [Heterodontus francisci]|uniref:uncharacterized protein n=1 Tax=Heterodontus francisci TaxID=7792 RepID=UPI00355B438D
MLCTVYLHLLFLLLPARSRSALLTQWGNRLMVAEGTTAEMHCFQNDTSESYMYWYRQQSGAGLQLIVNSIGTSDPRPEEGFKERFKITRPDFKSCSLKILRVEQTDRAVYYCAARDHSIAFLIRITQQVKRKISSSVLVLSVRSRNSQALGPVFQLKLGPTGGRSIKLNEAVTGVTVNLKNKVYLASLSSTNNVVVDDGSLCNSSCIPAMMLSIKLLDWRKEPPAFMKWKTFNGLLTVRCPPAFTDSRCCAHFQPPLCQWSRNHEICGVLRHLLVETENDQIICFKFVSPRGRNVKRNCRQSPFLEDMFQVPNLLFTGENDTIRPAKVTVFEPSPEEIREKKKATVVCLVSDFYPDNIKIHWLVDGKEKDANDTNIHTDLNAILSKENTSYSISSRLRFDALDWARSKNVECRVDLYTNESVPTTSSSTLAVKAEMCGISKEAKIQSMATAKLTYLILICKSIFYTIFISTIAWKTKTSYSKRFD